ncbi:MAG: M23 family peptidase, partial [Rhodoferax sp.]|nr:M23 family peptidase [Rhodoferax sp.]
MQLIITDAWLARSRAIHLTGLQLVAAFVASACVLMLVSVGIYHWVFLKGAREGWPIIGALVSVVTREDLAQRERFVRENLDLMARRMGQMQVKLTQLESLGERVSVLAGVPASAASAATAAGGPLVAPQPLSIEHLQFFMVGLEQLTHQRTDSFMVLESELFDLKMRRSLIPTQK